MIDRQLRSRRRGKITFKASFVESRREVYGRGALPGKLPPAVIAVLLFFNWSQHSCYYYCSIFMLCLSVLYFLSLLLLEIIKITFIILLLFLLYYLCTITIVIDTATYFLLLFITFFLILLLSRSLFL